MRRPFILKLSLLLALSFATSFSFAQTKAEIDSLMNESPLNITILKFSVFSLANTEPTLLFGIQYGKPSARLRMQHEIGYVSMLNPFLYFRNSLEATKVNAQGIRFHTAFKMPLEIEGFRMNQKYKYLGVDLMLKYYRLTIYDIPVRQGDWSYWQIMDLSYDKYVGAIHFIYGQQHYISKSNQIVADWYAGFGLRYKYIETNLPENVDFDTYFPFYDAAFYGMMLSLTAGLKIGVGI